MKKNKKNNEQVFYQKNLNDEILAMLYLKEENEEINLKTITYEKQKRIKIGTLKLSEKCRNQRLGEGAIGIALWEWQKFDSNQIYVTIFDKQQTLIDIFIKFGFTIAGRKANNELVLIKDKNNLNYETPFTSFPYINPNTKNYGVLAINDYYHDQLFPFSQLKRNSLDVDAIVAGNGFTKTFIGFPRNQLPVTEGDVVFLYRKCMKGKKCFESVITSYCSITNLEYFNKNEEKSFESFLEKVKNRTVFSRDELKGFYDSRNYFVIIDLLYNGFFGVGNNVNYAYLKTEGLFYTHPYSISYSKEDFIKILEKGKTNVQNVIID